MPCIHGVMQQPVVCVCARNPGACGAVWRLRQLWSSQRRLGAHFPALGKHRLCADISPSWVTVPTLGLPSPQDGYLKSAASAVQPGQEVRVRVMSVDPSTGRVALSMKGMQGLYTAGRWLHFSLRVFRENRSPFPVCRSGGGC